MANYGVQLASRCLVGMGSARVRAIVGYFVAYWTSSRSSCPRDDERGPGIALVLTNGFR